jgi:rfaE bifunctional protein kinase chain/domain
MDLASLVSRMSDQRAAVLGDLICDRFIYGSVERISPEAPVPVLLAEREEFQAGGAANVAHNITSLGGRAEIFGVLGDDFGARTMQAQMHSFGAGTSGVVGVPGRPTTRKTRMIASSQQLLRVDEEVTDPISAATEDLLLAALKEASANCAILVLSDYNKGVLTPRLCYEATQLFRQQGKPVVCDPKPVNLPSFREVTLLTPNRAEALHAAGIERVELDSLERAARRIRELTACDAVAITAGADGMYLLTDSGFQHLSGDPVEVYDVVGAGDTVCAVMALALAAGGSYEEAAVLANHAAAMVVGKLGLATVTAPELLARLGG